MRVKALTVRQGPPPSTVAQEKCHPVSAAAPLATDDAAKTLDATVTGGGRVLVDAMPVADLGTMAVVEDPTGASIGVWQPGLHRGFGVLGEANTPGWFELHARDYQAAVVFYREVFGWDTEAAGDTPEFRYTVQVGPDGGWLAGIMDAAGFGPAEPAGQWSVYFGVDDADAALARIVELGGQVPRPAEDTPYGRLATAADPTGALFRLVAPNAAMPARDGAT